MSTSGTFSPRSRIALIVLALVLALSYLLFSTWFRHKLEREAIEFRENMLWAVFQVQKELISTLRLSEGVVRGMDVSVDDIVLSFDILVSRVQLVQKGDGFSDLREVPEFNNAVNAIADRIDGIDEELARPGITAPEAATVLIDNLSTLERPIQRASLSVLHYVTERGLQRNAEISSLLDWMQILFVLDLVFIGVAIFIAFHQSLRAYRTAFKLEEQAIERRFLEETADRSKLEALGSLAGGVAHEINTPTQFVTTNLEFLKDAFDDLIGARDKKVSQEDLDFYRDEVPLAIAQSAEGMGRIRDIVKAIKHFAYPEEGGINTVNIAEEIRNAILLTGNQTKNVAEVETRIDPSLPVILGRTNELNQVLINLIINAAQAIEADGPADAADGAFGRIEVGAAPRDGHIEIWVQDNGPGIPADIARRVFNPFFTTKPVGVGSGQGLAISQRIVTGTFKGSIRVDETAVQGARFVIELPGGNIAAADQAAE
ncbi:MAG: hypothetical protein JJ878_17060 [Alphaproteobacteria bacterium]|nr:hypothetical protein [Alphaproteobacteria bacterium]MBO6864347.1 hypothetical protein [Alphaproteobacteria bacterium]